MEILWHLTARIAKVWNILLFNLQIRLADQGSNTKYSDITLMINWQKVIFIRL